MQSPRRCAMSRARYRPPKVEMGFTGAQLTSFGGWLVLGQMAERLGLPKALSGMSVKQRARCERRGDAVEPDRLAGREQRRGVRRWRGCPPVSKNPTRIACVIVRKTASVRDQEWAPWSRRRRSRMSDHWQTSLVVEVRAGNAAGLGSGAMPRSGGSWRRATHPEPR